MATVKVLVADDHAILRHGLRRVLEFEPDFEIVGEASDGGEALELTRILKPDVVVLDLTMPRLNGIEATRAIRSEAPKVGIVILSIHDDREYVAEAMKAGASYYCLKDVEPQVLVRAIRNASRGIKERDTLSGVPSSPATGGNLTPRELEVLRMIAQGASNREIARTLYISEKTCKNHISSIFAKLGVTDRTRAALYAIRQGWVHVHTGRKLGTKAD